MTKMKTGREEINDRLYRAIDELRKDATRVEIWATALSTFAQPIPAYQPDEKFSLQRTPKSRQQ